MEGKKRLSSTRLFEREAKLGRVSFLHEDCQGTKQDVARMEARLQQCHHLMEFRCKNTNETPLISAVLEGHELCVEFMLKKGADVHAIISKSKVNDTGNVSISGTALCFATHLSDSNESKLKIVSLLLENGSDPNPKIKVDNDTMLLITYFFKKKSLKFLKLCLKFGAEVMNEQVTPASHLAESCLFKTVFENEMEILEILLVNGVGVSDVATLQTLLIIAMRIGHLDCLKIVLLYNLEAELQIEYLKFSKSVIQFPYLLAKSTLFYTQNGLKILKVLHKFGCNIWDTWDSITPGNSVEAREVYAELERLRSRPLTLKELSRVAVLTRELCQT